MSGRFRATLVLLLGMAASTAAAAPVVRLSFSDGRVWLITDRASVGDILAEWSRVGSTRVVNGERVKGPLLTLEMSGVPETEALDVVLRAAGGFVAVGRTAGADSTAPNLSRFGQITVLPAATGVPAQAVNSVPAPAVAPPAIFTASGAMRIIGADGQPVPDDQEGTPPPPASPPTVVPAPAGVAVPGTMPAAPPATRP